MVTVDICDYIDNFQLRELDVYPNPVSNGILNLGSRCPECQYRIFDSSAKLIDSGRVQNSEIEISAAPGIYTLQIISEDLIRNVKFVVN